MTCLCEQGNLSMFISFGCVSTEMGLQKGDGITAIPKQQVTWYFWNWLCPGLQWNTHRNDSMPNVSWKHYWFSMVVIQRWLENMVRNGNTAFLFALRLPECPVDCLWEVIWSDGRKLDFVTKPLLCIFLSNIIEYIYICDNRIDWLELSLNPETFLRGLTVTPPGLD